MDDFEQELKITFIDEAILNLEEAENCFMELESASDPKPLIDQIFRLAHNLKGGSRSVGFGDVAEFTHELESLVLAIKNSQLQLSTELVSTLLRSNDWLIEMMTGLKDDMSVKFNNAEILNEIKGWLSNKKTNINPPVQAEPEISAPRPEFDSMGRQEEDPSIGHLDASEETGGAVADAFEIVEDAPPSSDLFFADDPVAETEDEKPLLEKANILAPNFVAAKEILNEDAPIDTQNIKSSRSSAQPSKHEKDDEVVRVNLSRIELLNDYVGELIVLQSVIQQQSLVKNYLKLDISTQQMVKLTKEIQNIAMGLRMLPVKPLVQKLQRVVRDTSVALNKKVHLELIGEQIDVDKSVLDRLVDPLIHILRNAVDHGLEDPEQRSAAGKPPVGRVHLGFYNEGNYLIIEVKDDGKGINTSVLRQKAIEKHLISEIDNLTDKQLIHLIFHPGFSTKEVTTEVSGRGVGMDVVKTNIDKIGGQLDVTTDLGKGSTFRIKIPLSLAVIEGLVTATTGSRYVIPLSQVQETVNLATIDIYPDKLGIGDCMELRGDVVPIYRLENLVNENINNIETADSTALLFNVEGRMVAVSVKELMHSQQVVIKPLSNGMSPQTGWVGSCVLGDGLPTLILSPVDLLVGKVKPLSQGIAA